MGRCRRRYRLRPGRKHDRRGRAWFAGRCRCPCCHRNQNGRRLRRTGRAVPPSTSSMIAIARTLGAPLTVPVMLAARIRSKAFLSAWSLPSTWLTMCMTWLYFLFDGQKITHLHRAKNKHLANIVALRVSTSMTCSARSSGSLSRSVASCRSSGSSCAAPSRPGNRSH